jgi:hypothetical protein
MSEPVFICALILYLGTVPTVVPMPMPTTEGDCVKAGETLVKATAESPQSKPHVWTYRLLQVPGGPEPPPLKAGCSRKFPAIGGDCPGQAVR